MDPETFIIDVIDWHHDNIDGEPAGAGIEAHENTGSVASVVLLFDDDTRIKVTAEFAR